QFDRLLAGSLWAMNARHANDMARKLEGRLRKIPGVTITQKVDANGIFVIIPPKVVATLQQDYFFYPWNEKIGEFRLMCSFDTTQDDVDQFVSRLEVLMAETPTV